MQRLRGNNKIRVKQLFDNHANIGDANILKTLQQLKENIYFSHVSGRTLYILAKQLQPLTLTDDQTSEVKNLAILWIFVTEGSVEITNTNGQTTLCEAGEHTQISSNYSKSYKAIGTAKGYLLPDNYYQLFLFDQPGLVNLLTTKTQDTVQ